MDFMFPRKSLSDDQGDFSAKHRLPSFVQAIWPFLESSYDALDASIMDGIVKKYLPNSPNFNELQLKVGGFMMNSISALVLSRRLPRNFEYVGGMHMEKREALVKQEVLIYINCKPIIFCHRKIHL